MAYDAFLKIEGVEGESTRDKHEGEIEILSFSWGASNPTTIGSGTGAGAGRASLTSFNIMKKSDKASPKLFQNCCQGRHFPKATVVFRSSAGDNSLEYLKYEFEEVFVESVQWSGSSGGDDRPTESLSLAFGKVEVTYTPQTATGDPGAPVVASWDQRSRTA
ncbi:MAG: type VI secretion system tube protein Hcp [Gemmatimonadales bacterium]|nr:MAG: type VI secretion system tube protein Hcp [Gemmatimonadales bacterium]